MNDHSDVHWLQTVRQHIHEELGTETVRELHRTIAWLDALAVAVTAACFVGVFVLIAMNNLPWPILVVLAVVQGWLIQTLGLIAHDLFVHRNMWKGRIGDLLGSMLLVPATISGRAMRLGHLRHHAKIGTDDDTEAGLANINTPGRRLLFLTLIGFTLARSGKWDPEGARGYDALAGATEKDHRLVRIEKRMKLVFLAGIALLAIFAPWQVVVFGYLIPMIIVIPILTSVRIVIEHAVVDPDNPFSLATPYKTGILSRIIYFWDSGDCHIVHHIFPRVPWYHIGRLMNLSWPILEAKGVVARTSLPALLHGWFVKNFTHRTNWPA